MLVPAFDISPLYSFTAYLIYAYREAAALQGTAHSAGLPHASVLGLHDMGQAL